MLFRAIFRRSRAFACAFALAALTPSWASAATTLNRDGLKLTFEDEFTTFDWDEAYAESGSAHGKWRTNYQHSSDRNALHNRTLPNNGELQVYVDKAFPEAGEGALGLHPFEIVDGGVLRISANPAPAGAADVLWDRPYTSGMIASWGSFAQRYGVFEMRAKLPRGKALWPAFWLLKQSGGWPPEIDIAEFIGQEPDRIYNVVHTGDGGHRGAGGPTIVGDLTKAFHTYTVDWGPTWCVFYFDGREIWRHATPPDANAPMFMIINLAVGGKWPGKPDAKTTFPAHLDVDYVRVWQRPEYENAPDPKPWPNPVEDEVVAEVASAPAAPAAVAAPVEESARAETWRQANEARSLIIAFFMFAALGGWIGILRADW